MKQNDNLIIRNYELTDYDRFAQLINVVLQLEKNHVPIQAKKALIDFHIYKYLQQATWIKVCTVNNHLVGILMAVNPLDKALYRVQTKQNFLNAQNKITTLKQSIRDKNAYSPKQMNGILTQLAVLEMIPIFVQEVDKTYCLNKSIEILFFCVDWNYQGLNIGKKLLQLFKQNFQSWKNQFWLLTDSNCNWKFYEYQGYHKIAERVVFNLQQEPFLDLNLQPYKLMVYKFA
ncbi:GNAT family N-acetyltransferase [[Mycoplasma] testudinis]|uniref:GNAT family N-acetyltransferase n=1 Tax=[Mycoplasma] testudinis TaxID=33924 RepID=UPI000486FD35|nr:GNAT family N-acetyltransferase [[Mycoplasma] testudinis]